MRCSTRAFAALAILAAAACTPPSQDVVRTGPTTPGQSASTEPSSRPNRNRITVEEMDELRSRGATDLLALIQRARPNWLRTRRVDQAVASEPYIIYNERRIASSADLRSIPSALVTSLEYISPPASVSRYGMQAEFGAIIIRGN
jgi:hypothetical protein